MPVVDNLVIIILSRGSWIDNLPVIAYNGASNFILSSILTCPSGRGRCNLYRALFIFLVVAIVAALGYLGYIIINPKPGANFTEFYILNREGESDNYPGQVVTGESVDIIIEIVNHEYKSTSYRVDIIGYGIDNKEIRIDELAHGEKFQEMVSFVPQLVGEEQEVEFWLYKNGELEPYFPDPLRLYIDVIEP